MSSSKSLRRGLPTPSLVVAAWPLGPVEPGGLRQCREVLAAVAVQGNAAAQPTPSDPHIMQGRGLGIHSRKASSRIASSAASLVLGTHDMHAL
jgi:hypothetical protein